MIASDQKVVAGLCETELSASYLHLELGALLVGPFCGLQVAVLILPDVSDADLSGATQWSSCDLKRSEAVIPQ